MYIYIYVCVYVKPFPTRTGSAVKRSEARGKASKKETISTHFCYDLDVAWL